ncbi:hypothetical protein G7046_g6313 [Stylonectria norvegica]|nr:hypothetical protein G7046_g6313 [Stylonectria norvegica]
MDIPDATPSSYFDPHSTSVPSSSSATPADAGVTKKKPRRGADDATGRKRRVVSTACVACRRRKSKCDGAVPTCASCAIVYGTECVYDPNSDHRRKGVYREKTDSEESQKSNLRVIIDRIRDADMNEVSALVRSIRTCDSYDQVADQILQQQQLENEQTEALDQPDDDCSSTQPVQGERDLAGKMGELRLENGSVRFIGGTSHLIYLGASHESNDEPNPENLISSENPITSWSRVTQDALLVTHLINMYFNWHYPYFTTLSKTMFLRDFNKGKSGLGRGTAYCSSLLVNTMLALGCHFTSVDGAYGTPGDTRTKGDHFFAEAKRLIHENDEYEKPRLVTVQALALMSVREAGCAREAKGWVYSGMSFRMAEDIGLNLDVSESDMEKLSDHEIDARRITFWGCYLFDKCWSNYLGRLPQLSNDSFNVPKFDVFPDEDAELWSPYTDNGFDQSSKQPSRTRAVALQLSKLCEISSDLLVFFYHPNNIGKSTGKSVELKKLSELHRRLEEWHKELPNELQPKEGQLPNVILMQSVEHPISQRSKLIQIASMFFHLQYIHLFRPFLKYLGAASPLAAHISARRICTSNAGIISKLLRLYKKHWGLRQICNIAVYMVHSACTIHLLNLPEKTARRDITHGVKHLEEIAEDWLCARRSLSIISVLARKWNCELPEDAAFVLQRADEKYGTYSTSDVPSPRSNLTTPLSDGGLGQNLGGDYSPVKQYPQTQLSGSAQQLSTTNSMTTNVPFPAVATVQFSQQQRLSMDNIDSLGMDLDPDTMAGWSPDLVTQPTSNFQLPFVAVNQLNVTSSPAVQTSNTPERPSRRMGMDTQEWFLNDSARWHQSFEMWQMAQGEQDPSVFVFGDTANSGTPTPGTGGNDSMLAEMAEQLSEFGGTAQWLPNLD